MKIMRKKRKTGFLLLLLLILLGGCGKTDFQIPEQETEQTVSTQGGAHKEGVYYLKNRNGYVIVYLDDQTSIYEYTNIRVEELPEELQNEIREGKRLEGKDKLYGFLENYSS